MNTRPQPARLTLMLPVQARPVCRADWAAPAHQTEGGVEAAQSVCSNLRGLARQMCYATVYDVST